MRNVIKPALWSGRIQLIDGVFCGSGSVVGERKEWSQHPQIWQWSAECWTIDIRKASTPMIFLITKNVTSERIP